MPLPPAFWPRWPRKQRPGFHTSLESRKLAVVVLVYTHANPSFEAGKGGSAQYTCVLEDDRQLARHLTLSQDVAAASRSCTAKHAFAAVGNKL